MQFVDGAAAAPPGRLEQPGLFAAFDLVFARVTKTTVVDRICNAPPASVEGRYSNCGAG